MLAQSKFRFFLNMPLIKSIEFIPDDGGGVRITTTRRGVVQFTRGQLSAAVLAGTTQQIEDAANSALATLFANDSFNVQVHVLTTNPLSVQVIASDNPILANWWLI